MIRLITCGLVHSKHPTLQPRAHHGLDFNFLQFAIFVLDQRQWEEKARRAVGDALIK